MNSNKLIAELKGKIEDLEMKIIEQGKSSKMFSKFFITQLSHEIRNPLNAVLGFSELIQTYEFSDEKKKEFTQYLKAGADQLIYLIDNFTELSIADDTERLLNYNICNTESIIESCLEYAKKTQSNLVKNNILIICPNLKTPHYSYKFISDEKRILLALKNLINNAIKFTDKGFVEIGYTIEEGSVQFYISDAGPGYSNNETDIDFNPSNPFPLDSKKGLGIGLIIVKKIARLLHGELHHEKNAIGTTFYLNVPILKERNYEALNFQPYLIEN